MEPPRRTSSAAIVSLVFGILAWVALPLIGSIVAVVSGHIARGEIRRSPDVVEGDGLAVAGLVLGWIQLGVILLIGGLFILAIPFLII